MKVIQVKKSFDRRKLTNKDVQIKMLLVNVVLLLVIISLVKYDNVRNRYITSPYFAQNTHLIVTNASRFDPNRDWLVLFHVQKTSGSSWDYNYMIGSLMVRERLGSGGWHDACYQQYGSVQVDNDDSGDEKRLRGNYCRRPANSNESWYLSWNEKSFGWACGLHPYYSDLKNCVRRRLESRRRDNESRDEFARRFYYMALLRDPVKRFYSEYKQTSVAGTMWINERPAMSPGHQCVNDYHKKCSPNETGVWSRFSLDEYMTCEYNVAINRQTRMLAGYDDQDDYNNNGSGGQFTLCNVINQTSFGQSVKYDEELLSRATANLHSLSFFGLAEQQVESKRLFVKMFNKTLRFRDINRKDRVPLSLRLMKGLGFEYSSSSLSPQTVKKIRNVNYLDVRLYEYAKELFQSRLEYYRVI